MNVLLMHLPDPALAPPGLLPLLESLQRSAALSLVVLGDGPQTPPAGRHLSRAFSRRREEVVAVLLGPAVAHAMVATPDGDGRYDVRLTDDGEAVAAAARELIARAR